MSDFEPLEPELVAVLRAREKHARDIERVESARAEMHRPPSRRSEPTQLLDRGALESIARILAENGVSLPSSRPSFEERIAPREMSPQDQEYMLRRRVDRDVLHTARNDIYDMDTNSKFQDTKALRAARFWLNRNVQKVLLLCGTKGAGKTFAAAWAVREYLRANPSKRVCWLKATQLVGAVMFPGNDEDTPSLSSFVVVDDVGREMQTPETFGEALSQLLETPDIRVILTTNMTREAQPGRQGMSFAERYSDRLTSRMNGRAMAVDCLGDDLRGDQGGF